MIRAALGDSQYWSEREAKDRQWMERASNLLAQPSANPVYRAQFAFDFAKDHLRAAVRTYSQGDSVCAMAAYLSGALEAWEMSNAVADELCAENKLETCRDWRFELTDLNHYIWCFWLVGLALALSIPRAQWLRLVGNRKAAPSVTPKPSKNCDPLHNVPSALRII